MRLAFRSTSCNNRISALLRPKNSMIRGSCSPRLMFQHTTLTELGGQRSHRGLAKLPVSISGTVSISLVYGLSFRGRAPQPTFNSTCISFSFGLTRLCLLFSRRWLPRDTTNATETKQTEFCSRSKLPTGHQDSIRPLCWAHSTLQRTDARCFHNSRPCLPEGTDYIRAHFLEWAGLLIPCKIFPSATG